MTIWCQACSTELEGSETTGEVALLITRFAPRSEFLIQIMTCQTFRKL
jgi:hypothetical protein